MSGRPFAPLRRPAAGYADAPTTTIPPVRPVPAPAPPAAPCVRRTVVDRLLAVLLGDERPGTHRRARNAGRHRTTTHQTTGDIAR